MADSEQLIGTGGIQVTITRTDKFGEVGYLEL
jgi:hypothetical protein